MGRVKKNKPRRERPGGIPRTVLDPAQAALHQWVTESADVLGLPTITSEEETGLVLDVAAVGFNGAGLLTGAEPAWVRRKHRLREGWSRGCRLRIGQRSSPRGPAQR